MNIENICVEYDYSTDLGQEITLCYEINGEQKYSDVTDLSDRAALIGELQEMISNLSGIE